MDQKKETAQAAEKKQAKSEESPAPYTAVVYFHGMGSQRRYEEVSRLVDSLDGYARSYNSKQNVGLLCKIKAQLEMARGERTDTVSYIRAMHPSKGRQQQQFRFYEVYWAPLMAGGISTREVVKWLLGRLGTPAKMGRTPWRLRPRLKRAALYRLWDDLEKSGKNPFHKDDFKAMLEDYHAFESSTAVRQYRKGSFDDFLEFIGGRRGKNAELRERLLELAKQWRQYHNRTEFFTLAMLLTFICVLLIAGAIAVASVVILFNTIGISEVADFLQEKVGWKGIEGFKRDFGKIDYYFALALSLFTVLGLVRIRTFLREYLGDVQLWTTYEETDEKYKKRKDVLRVAFEQMKHVLNDELCDRVVIIGHSLGTTIAHDTLLELGRHNRARQNTNGKALSGLLPLQKIEHFITLGSPIDKVHYFFESHKSKNHRYNRVVEDVRGDLGELPFAMVQESHDDSESSSIAPYIHWINFWDRADLVSSSLETPCNKLLPHLKVDNYHVPHFYFPDPVKSHTIYFENAEVIKVVFEAIFNRRYSYQTVSPKTASNYAAQNLGPGKQFRSTFPLQMLMLTVPWLILGTMAAHLTPLEWLKDGFLYCTAALIAFLLIMWLFSKTYGMVNPITPPDANEQSGSEMDSTSSDHS